MTMLAIDLWAGYVVNSLWLLPFPEAEVSMRLLIGFVALMVVLVAVPAKASLPYYNQDLGYTIWLPKNWSEVSGSYLRWAESSRKPVPIQGDASNWTAGYHCPANGRARSLLVEVKHGRRMLATDISNFNRFIVKTLSRQSSRGAGASDQTRIALKDATYFKEKKILRLSTEMNSGDRTILSLTYIVYTRIGMLTFVGYVDPGDSQARQVIDKAVLSLYLDDNVRY